MTTLQVYMVMYSTEISIVAALLVGFGIGALIFYQRGKDKGNDIGLTLGYDWGYGVGRQRGFMLGESQRQKRDAKGRYTK